MRFEPNLTAAAVIAELGARVERHRLERNLTQEQLAHEAGVGRATLQRIERGESVQLASLIGVLRALGLIEGLEGLVPEPVPSPIERLKTGGRSRQRARASSQAGGAAPRTWTWDDQEPR